VRIPAGVQTGSRVRVPGAWNAGTSGAPGRLNIITDVQGRILFLTAVAKMLYKAVVPITVTKAAIGRRKLQVRRLNAGRFCACRGTK